MSTRILIGDTRQRLRDLPDNSVHCCVTSPPYFGLRSYLPDGHDDKHMEIGLEPTPAAFVEVMVDVFREVRRVMRPDATLWLNLGDSYSNAGTRQGDRDGGVTDFANPQRKVGNGYRARVGGLKNKDLIGIPWRVAFALQQPYYTGKIKDEIDRVWLAAMVDAEGSICGTEYEAGERIKTNIYISVTNTSVPIIDKCERLFPQAIKHVYEKSGPSSRVCYRWDVERMETKALFLREIYPYLVAKRKQAAVAYTFIEMQRGLISKKKGYLPDQQEQRSWLMAMLSRLNAGEDVDLPDWITEPPSLFEPGFYLRQDIIWAKPNPMPESVTDRCTKAHEYLFLLSKSARYYFDAEAIAEPAIYGGEQLGIARGTKRRADSMGVPTSGNEKPGADANSPLNRNRRSVWNIATQPYSEAHFATFPPDLVEPCILAGTAQSTCKTCGAPWRTLPARAALVLDGIEVNPATPARSWCGHDAPGGPPCTVLDPFGGAGTTALVADRLQRDGIIIELNPDYAELARARIKGDAPLFAEVA